MSEDVPKPVTGRTWADAAAEGLGRIFDLLGKSVIYLIFFAAVAGIYYFFQDQDGRREAEFRAREEKREAQWSADRASLQAQRDAAFDQLRAFNQDIADISGKQVTIVGDAFEKLKTISGEAEGLREKSYQSQLAELAARERSEETTRTLDQTRAELARREKELETRTGELASAQAQLEARDQEIKKKEVDLERRAQRIGELSDLIGELGDSAAAAIAAERGRNDALAAVAQELLAVSSVPPAGAAAPPSPQAAQEARAVWEELQDALHTEAASAPEEIAFNDALSRLRDRVVEPADILRPLADLSQPPPPLDDLIGLSADRLRAAILESDGFGLDVWLDLALGPEGGMPTLGGIRFGPGRLRLVSVSLSGETDLPRISAITVEDAMLPVCGALPERVWSSGCIAYGPLGSIDLERVAVPEAGLIPFSALGSATVLFRAAGAPADGIPVLDAAGFAALAGAPDLAPWQVAFLADPRTGPRAFFAIQRALEAPEATAARLTAGSGDPELAATVRAVLSAALKADPASLGELIDPERIDPAVLYGPELEPLASIAAHPAAELRMAPPQREAAPVRQQVQQQPAGEDWIETATADLILPGETARILSFSRSSADPRWRLAGIGFTRMSRW